jgi:endonuclease YncB( thermonuclease family)
MTDNEKPWRLVGWDTFDSEPYPVSIHATEQECRAAAREFLRQLELHQPSELSGGQEGLQDHVFILGPSGETYRYERVADA